MWCTKTMDTWFSIVFVFKKGIQLKTIVLFCIWEILFKFEANGITGKIKFDENGLRTDVAFEVVDLAADGVHKVGIIECLILNKWFVLEWKLVSKCSKSIRNSKKFFKRLRNKKTRNTKSNIKSNISSCKFEYLLIKMII